MTIAGTRATVAAAAAAIDSSSDVDDDDGVDERHAAEMISRIRVACHGCTDAE